MSYICPLCKLQPLSHSLTKISEKNDIIYYYTCPSQAILYYDVESILNHYDGVLSEIPKDKKWIWIFDSLDFNLTHALQINVAIEITKLITNKFSTNLNKIIIINPTFYITMTYNVVMPFLNETIKNIIEINYEKTTSNEVIL
jgi:hypothetical protein